MKQVDGQISIFDLDTWCGKTLREPLAHPEKETEKITGGKISKPYSPKSLKSSAQALPMFLYLEAGGGQNGQSQDASWVLEKTDARFPSLTDYTMHSFGEYPNVERESRLSQILEEQPHPKYSLSAKACQGILNRAKKRGKLLPKILEQALIKQSVSKSGGGKPGGGKGILIQDEHVGALSTLNNQMVCIEGNGSRDSHKGDGYKKSETMYTLNTVEQHAVCYGISSYDSNAMKSPNPNSGIYKADKSRTLDLNGGNPGCNQGGLMVVQRIGINGAIAGTLDASYYKGCGERHGIEREIILESKQKLSNVFMDAYQHHGYRENNTCGTLTRDQNQGIRGDTPLIVKTYQEKTGTLDCCISKGTSNQLANNNMFVANDSIVRRLTPMECERLQGFPDHWTDIGEWIDSKGKKHKDADSPRYKALGNSIALPFWRWMAERKQCEYIWKPVYDEYRRIGYRLKKQEEYHQITIDEVLNHD